MELRYRACPLLLIVLVIVHTQGSAGRRLSRKRLLAPFEAKHYVESAGVADAKALKAPRFVVDGYGVGSDRGHGFEFFMDSWLLFPRTWAVSILTTYFQHLETDRKRPTLQKHEPWFLLLATTNNTLRSYPQADIIALTEPLNKRKN